MFAHPCASAEELLTAHFIERDRRVLQHMELVEDDLGPIQDLGDGVQIGPVHVGAHRLDSGALAIARGVLRDFGNMSAATVLFVLEQTLRAGVGGTLLMTTLGPGFTAGFQIVEAA